MIVASLPLDEPQRLACLKSYGILDTVADEGFDRITRVARTSLKVPIALVTLVDDERQWFKSRIGLGIRETCRDTSFCAHTILEPHTMIVEDTFLDPRFYDNPLVTGDPHIRFYAGVPLIGKDGYRLGSLCIIDRKPRSLSPEESNVLADLAGMASDELKLFRQVKELNDSTIALKAAHEQLEHFNMALRIKASTDALTGLANRGSFDETIEREWRRGTRNQRPLSLIMVDIDHFKRYNDLFGHPAGDRCLSRVAAAIRSCITRPGDLAARYGGEEFAVVLPETNGEGALAIARRICQNVANTMIDHPGNDAGIVTVSAGVFSMIAQRRDTKEALLKGADLALYQAKETGRNRACCETGTHAALD